jgi:hypothetical protein
VGLHYKTFTGTIMYVKKLAGVSVSRLILADQARSLPLEWSPTRAQPYSQILDEGESDCK